MIGLYDKQLADCFAVVKVQTAAEAERQAAEGEAVRRDQKSRKSLENYLLPLVSSNEPERAEGDLNLREEEEEPMATLAGLTDRSGSTTNVRVGRREATSTRKCYNCN